MTEPRRPRTVRWTDSEWEELGRRAAAVGLRRSAYLRALALEVPPIRRRPKIRSASRAKDLQAIAKVADAEDQTERLGPPRMVRFTPEEWIVVVERAELLVLSPTRFIRFAALGYPLRRRIDAAGVRELNRIGNNLNQLARAANTARQPVSIPQIEQVLKELCRAFDKLT